MGSVLWQIQFQPHVPPGSKNVKPDALSRQFHDSRDSLPVPDSTLPAPYLIGSLTWEIEALVRTALQTDPDPGGGPQGRLFVPVSVRSQVLQWCHTSRFACHPGSFRTLSLLERHFWWPTMTADTRDYVKACAVCARGKALHRPPAGLLRPLPVPGRPWSHIVLDFVTGLPLLQGNDTILTIVDRFSKVVHFVALPKLPSATETAQLQVDHSLCIHGIPADIVSDRGPQFTSGVWKEFCLVLGATVSLSLGYHPQSKSQTERANLTRVSLSPHLTHSPHLGRILTQLPSFSSYRYDTIRGLRRLFTTSVSLSGAGDCRAIGSAQPPQDLQDLEGDQSGSPAHFCGPEPEVG